MSHNQRKTNNEFMKTNMSDHSQKSLHTDKNILDKSYQLVKHFPDFPLWE